MADPAHLIEIRIDDGTWETAGQDLAAVVRRAARAALEASAGRDRQTEVSILLTDSRMVCELNNLWRDKPEPTNVLSFPNNSGPSPDGGIELLGDVVLAYEVLEREARHSGLLLAHHVSHLVVHGVLHLLGYDHVDENDALTMEGLETAILGSLEIPDPYRSAETELERAPS